MHPSDKHTWSNKSREDIGQVFKYRKENRKHACPSFNPLIALITLRITEEALKTILGSYFISAPKISA